mgnify:CR=1 FL=1
MNNRIDSFVINAQELKKLIDSNEIKIIDCRWFLDHPEKGAYEYKKSHIPNAVYYDLEKNTETQNNLPHMIPSKKKFSDSINKLGISKKDHIVIYDQIGFFCSARIWYTLKLYGFKKLRILNGGFKSWQEKKLPTTKIIPKTLVLDSKFKIIQNKIVKKKELEEMFSKKKEKIKLIDARSKNRFLGYEPEPRKNIKSGNIPGSINIPFNKISDKNGNLLNFNKLKKLFELQANIKKNDKVICMCGSGITACNIIFSLDILDYKNINLYDGSWVEWGKQ